VAHEVFHRRFDSFLIDRLVRRADARSFLGWPTTSLEVRIGEAMRNGDVLNCIRSARGACHRAAAPIQQVIVMPISHIMSTKASNVYV
jgi:hypothetical protein